MVVLTERMHAYPGRVIFDHLAKTAGQAVNTWLRGTIGEGCVTINLIGTHRDLIVRYGGAYSVISAHVGFFGEGLDPRYQYVTCFREPIDRCVSWLFFVKESCQTELGVLQEQVEKFISAEGDCDAEPALKGHIGNYYVEHFAAIEGPCALSDSEKLEKALGAVEDYDVWGFHEAMPEFLDDFAALLCVPPPKQLQRVNVTRARPRVDRISATLRKRLQALNTLDTEFYGILRERYAEARRRWQQTKVSVTCWAPYQGPPDRTLESPDLSLLSVTLEGAGSYPVGSLLVFSLAFSLGTQVEELELGIHIFDNGRRWAFGTNTTLLQQRLRAPSTGTYEENWALAADLPEGDFSAGFSFAERSWAGGGVRELAWFDKLVTFRIVRRADARSVGYASLPAAVTWRYVSDQVVAPIIDARGSLHCAAVLGDLVIDESVTLPLVLANEASQTWGSLALHPLYLSCRWVDEAGNLVQEEGALTRLPIDTTPAGDAITVLLPIRAPGGAGCYRLQVIPVQEGGLWFDKLGFLPLDLTLRVSAPDAERQWPAGDFRFGSEVGLLNSLGLRVSNGRAGYLIFGPYTRVAAGAWTIVFDGALDPVGRSIRVDVVAQQGRQSLASMDLLEARTSIQLEFNLDDAVEDMEFRVWVDEGCTVRIVGVALKKSRNASSQDTRFNSQTGRSQR